MLMLVLSPTRRFFFAGDNTCNGEKYPTVGVITNSVNDKLQVITPAMAKCFSASYFSLNATVGVITNSVNDKLQVITPAMAKTNQ